MVENLTVPIFLRACGFVSQIGVCGNWQPFATRLAAHEYRSSFSFCIWELQLGIMMHHGIG